MEVISILGMLNSMTLLLRRLTVYTDRWLTHLSIRARFLWLLFASVLQ